MFIPVGCREDIITRETVYIDFRESHVPDVIFASPVKPKMVSLYRPIVFIFLFMIFPAKCVGSFT